KWRVLNVGPAAADLDVIDLIWLFYGDELLSGERRRVAERRPHDAPFVVSAVIRLDDDERVVELAFGPEPGDHAPHGLVHALDRRGVERHLARQIRLLWVPEVGPDGDRLRRRHEGLGWRKTEARVDDALR